MLPSRLYEEDTTASTTLQNGTVLKWTKKITDMYTVNAPADKSIIYTNWGNNSTLTYGRKTPNTWYSSCDSANPFLGNNTAGVTNNQASGWTRNDSNAPRVDGIFTGVVLSNANSGYCMWGTNPLVGSMSTSSSAQNDRFLLDMEINKMVFNVSIDAVKISDMPTDSMYLTDPTNNHMPNTSTITLKELVTHPNDYYVTSVSFGGTLVYGENTNDHWRSANIKPGFLVSNGESCEGFVGINIHGTCYGTALLSHGTQAGQHPTSTAGGSSQGFVNHLNEGYWMGFPKQFVISPPDNSYDVIGQTAMNTFAANYDTSVQQAGRRIHVQTQTLDFGNSVIFGVYSSNVYNSGTPLQLKYNNLEFYWRYYLKGSYVSSWLASLGLYFMTEAYDPDTDSLTPTTLGNSDKIILGEMTADGTTTGNWITDIPNYTGPNKDGKTSNPNYTPSGGGGSGAGGGDNEIDIPARDHSSINGFVKYYIIDRATADRLSDSLSRVDWTTIGRDLMACLISYKLFAVSGFSQGAARTITIGGVEMTDAGGNGIQGIPVTGVTPIHISGITIPQTFNDFRDFAPYTKIEIFVPFCGWAQLPSWCMGKTITGDLYIDLANGTIKALIYASRTVVAELGGNCATDIPFSATANGVKAANVLTNLASGMTAAFNPTPQGVISGGVGILTAFNSNYTNVKGVMGDGSNIDGITCVLIKVTRPASIDNDGSDLRTIPSQYKHDRGIPCGKSLTLAAGDGYTQVLDANIAGTMTAAEKQMIIDGFRHGLIISPTPS